jgi:hypothetical protein
MGVTPFDLLSPNQPKANQELQNKRITICKSCDKLISKVNVCKECGCIMPLKVTLDNATCPLGKW